MNISKIESTWSQELAEYMDEKYGIDINEVICDEIRKTEDDEIRKIEDVEIVRIMEQIAQKMLKYKIGNTPENF